MVNFIICEDNDHVRGVEERIVSKVAMPFDFQYKIETFDKYSSKLKNLINYPADNKIYILDIELPNKSGVDIAREIRRIDWDSIIIILTSHTELEMKLLKDKLLILDFISKFDKFESRLEDTLKMVVKRMSNAKGISFKSKKELHHVKLDNILYAYKDNASDMTIIVTQDEEYPVRIPLVDLEAKLDSRFYRSHRACLVNTNKIKKIDFINSVIYFEGGKVTDYLSRNYKKGLRG